MAVVCNAESRLRLWALVKAGKHGTRGRMFSIYVGTHVLEYVLSGPMCPIFNLSFHLISTSEFPADGTQEC
jgi:hypothetical protein